MIRLYIIGLSILIGAILANYVAGLLQIMSWYEFLQKSVNAKSIFVPLKIKDALWLFIIYPFLLGVSSLLGDLCYQKLF